MERPGTYLREIFVWATPRRQLAARKFYSAAGRAPVVLLSAGIGATPVLAMLHALAGQVRRVRCCGCTRRVMGSIIRLPAKSAA